MSNTKRNVTVTRKTTGTYQLTGKMGFVVAMFDTEDWRQLGLRPLRRGTTAIIDLQVSGVPKAKKRKG